MAAIPSALLGSFAATHTYLLTMWQTYSSAFIFSTPVVVVAPKDILLTVIINLACTALAATIATRQALNNHVATLLRPKAPGIGNRILLERLTPLWQRFSFQQKITARNLFRYKKRSTLTIIGVAGCTALLIVGFSISQAVTNLFGLQLDTLTRQDFIVLHDAKALPKDLRAFNTDLKEAGPFKQRAQAYLDAGTFSLPGNADQTINVVVPKDNQFQQITHWRKRHNHQALDLSNGALITERTAYLLKLKPGDVFHYKDSQGKSHAVPIAGITENYIGHYLYLSPETYRQTIGEPLHYNADYIQLTSRNDADTFARHILKNKIAFQVISGNVMRSGINDMVKSLQTMVMVILSVSMALALVVLYNLTNINVEERLRELSTIKVLGFYPYEVSRFIYRETALLTVLGIFIGLPLGKALEGAIVFALAPPHVMMDPSIPLTAYLYATLFTTIVSLIVLLLMHRKINHIDMVEALKSIE